MLKYFQEFSNAILWDQISFLIIQKVSFKILFWNHCFWYAWSQKWVFQNTGKIKLYVAFCPCCQYFLPIILLFFRRMIKRGTSISSCIETTVIEKQVKKHINVLPEIQNNIWEMNYRKNNNTYPVIYLL